ncbi:HAD domain-containing protein [Ralstonia pseudosolanacearum]|uniref:HAD domain-containing protein n=1 Tax=Ralstonia pseudosolanacearum TaxID=1310165 RepID=UPI0026751468|nr:HAD domain-containing protein [Ralstonia pseudosolanacearum]MDO3622828.1 HAD domain-containing protein [Ralstonia pseudosolanacearum]
MCLAFPLITRSGKLRRAMASVLFLDFDGCLHPDNVHRVDGAPVLLTEGNELFEHVQLLVDALEPYPSLQIVLSTRWVPVFGFDESVARLPASLRSRVAGTIHEFCNDRWEWAELSRFDQVMRYVDGKGIESWLALDDDNHAWPESYEKRLVCPKPRLGVGELRIQQELANKLRWLHEEAQQGRQLNEA